MDEIGRATSTPFQLGVIADVQYADTQDGTNFAKTTTRHFRGSLRVLEKAVDYWNASSLDLVANLGDTVDGRCVRLGQTESATTAVINEFARCRCPQVVHLVGNHDLYNFTSRDELDRWLHTRGNSHLEYRAVSPNDSLRILILDSYRISLLWPPGHPHREEAQALLRRKNPNDVESSDRHWFKGLSGEDRRFVPYNGGLGHQQMAWLRAQLREAQRSDQQVLILTHVPLHPLACDGTTMLWDFDEALSVVEEFEGSVVAVIAGHDHKGGYACKRGVHHITLKSPLNLGDTGLCFGQIKVARRELEIQGPRLSDLLDHKLLEEDRKGDHSNGNDSVICRFA